MNHQSKKTIAFVVRGDPKAQKRHRTGKGFHYDPSKSAKSDFLLLAHQNIPTTPISGPITLSVEYFMPIPQSWPKYRKLEANNDDMPHIKTPDVDNLLKFTMDAMAPFWVDDRLINSIYCRKMYSHTPRTSVTVVYEE